MAHVYTSTLLFITCLQLCRTELTGTWYSANVINNGDFSPKPISEIFSTRSPPFSPTNPIVVLPPSSTAAPPPISTSLPPTLPALSTFPATGLTRLFSKTPSTFLTQPTYETSSTPLSFAPTISTQPTYVTSTPPPFGPTVSTQTTFEPSSTPPPFGPTFLERRPPVFELQPLPFPAQEKPQPNGPPNYFLIYQQAPQAVQQQQQQTFPTGISAVDVTSPTFRPEITTPGTTLSSFSPEFSTSTFRPELSTFSTFRPETSSPLTTFFQPPVTRPSTTLSTVGPVMSTPSTFGTFTPGSSTFSTDVTTAVPTTLITASPKTSLPCRIQSSTPLPAPRYPALKIRMVAPSGSITNIHVNPSQSTTRTPIKRATTIRKITTTKRPKTKKPGRNSYDGCVRMCHGKKPICAVPLAQAPIDPDKLKGFASICHMACHNSFNKDHYEMLMDGRCGKLRTRIQTVDSNKLKRVELNKAQYTVIRDNPETVVEFSSLPRK